MVCQPLSTDLGVLAEMYEEFHLLRCRTCPDTFCPPFEDSFYFNQLSDILLYSDDELIVSVDEKTDFIKGFAVFGIKEDASPILRKRKVCKVNLLVVRRGSEESCADSEMLEFIRNYAAENECSSVEFSVPSEGSEIGFCQDGGFEPKTVVMELKLKQEHTNQ